LYKSGTPKPTNVNLIPRYIMKFGKRNPINAGIKMALELNINVSLFIIYRYIKKVVSKKIKLAY